MSTQQSNNDSQNDTLFESQMTGFTDAPMLPHLRSNASSQSEENRRLHQDHKTIKRAIDRINQESSSAFASLHEKTSKLNLSVSDVHSDLKKLERAVIFENDSMRPSTVDMEIKLGNIARGLETKLLSGLSQQISSAIDGKLKNLFASLENKLLKQNSSNRREQENICSVRTSVEELKSIIEGVQRDISELCETVEAVKQNTQASSAIDLSGHRVKRSRQHCNGYQPTGSYGSREPASTAAASFEGNMLQRMNIPEMTSVDKNESIPSNLCVTIWSSVNEMRTSCGNAFFIADAMRSVDRQWSYALVDGWPTASENVASETSSSASKRKKI
ncbi:hypothetical protein BX661DRAFT_170108 [Kickxella alabastrina]|uniref:uncharacterized protein n=1 Tax=Kickxella alabastrina TaxID=61397 RepID=UPI00222033E1|nr:uncharacterized protein BX661DRAFT_170108 [Kickxella alabastrina]KAI7830915.1 hypothetical protein BX661DRAFT_170108 [Kickxella alabastrina]